MPLRAPFRIAGREFHAMPVLVAELSQQARIGRGEASGVYYLDDGPDSLLAILEAHRNAIEAGVERETLRHLLPPGGARNAIDCATWELEARLAGTTVAKLAGMASARPLPTLFTLGADDPARVAEGAKRLSATRAIKLKLDGDLDADIERLRALRAARPDAWLAVDANQGYHSGSIEPLLRELKDQHIAQLEQPFPRGQDAAMTALAGEIVRVADESVQGLDDMAGLAGRFDVVNIKLDKCGGLTEALHMMRLARQMKLRVMVGNMLGSSWAAAPGFVLGQFCDVVDLDGPTFIAEDREHSVVYRDGLIHCPDAVWGGTEHESQ